MSVDSRPSTERSNDGGRRRGVAVLPLLVAWVLLAVTGCSTKALVSSPCGSVDTVSEVQPLILSVTGSFPDTTATHLVLVVTTPSGATREFLSSSLSTTIAIIPLSALPRLPSGTYPAQWMMNGCGTPHQTQILGPGSVTVTS